MAKHLAAKTSIGLAALAATIAGCAVIESLDEEYGSDEPAPIESTLVPPDPYDLVLLDGSTMTIAAGNEPFLRFTEGIPTAIHSLDLHAQDGDCHQIKSDAESWAAQVSDTQEGRVSSAYANHANSVYAYLECGRAARPIEAVDSAGAVRYDTCKEAIAADGGNYLFGIDPEYTWYEDRDGDGVVCEHR